MDTKQLKAKILDLAIHGKLVPQEKIENGKLTAENDAHLLLQKIREEKEAKIKAGELKRDKNDSYIFVGDDNRHYEKFVDGTVKDIEDEIPFDVPAGWAWCRLPSVCAIPITDGTHQTPTYSDKKNGFPFLSSKDVTTQKIDWTRIKFITKELHEELQKRVKPQKNDILLAKNGTTGIAAIVETDRVFDIYVTLALLRPVNLIYPKYLLNVVNSPFCKEQFNGHLTGIGVPNLHLNDICKTLIPLPPLAEQKQIVSEIERIFTLIDSIENDKSDLQTAIKQAKSKILDLAIHGKLVPQEKIENGKLTAENDARLLLQKIREEKEAKIKAGELKRDKNDSYIYKSTTDNRHYEKLFADGKTVDETENEIEVPFDVPENWCWCRLPEICRKKITDGTHNSPPTTEKGDFLYITAKNIKDNKIDISNVSYVTKEIHDSIYKRCPVELNDILLTKDGTIGEVAINNLTCQFSLLSSVALIKPAASVLPLFLVYVLKSSYLQQKMKQDAKGVALKRIILEQISEFLIPIPPLAEQQRIVEKIETTFAYLDEIALNLV